MNPIAMEPGVTQFCKGLLDALEKFGESISPLGLYASADLMADGRFAVTGRDRSNKSSGLAGSYYEGRRCKKSRVCSNGCTQFDRARALGQTETYGVFEARGGFGKLCEAIWLSVLDDDLTVLQIQARTGGNIRTVRAKLKLLSEYSILFKTDTSYRANPNFDFAALARNLGTNKKDIERKRMHNEQRRSHQEWCKFRKREQDAYKAQRAVRKGELAS
jgi:hypothetical protein